MASSVLGLTVMLFDTPVTPRRFLTASCAWSLWKFHSTCPSSVTHPFSTLTFTLSEGTSQFHLKAFTISVAMSLSSFLAQLPAYLTKMFSTTAFTPATRLTASSASDFLVYPSTVPVRVITPSLAETPISASRKIGSHLSSAITSCCSCESVFMFVLS